MIPVSNGRIRDNRDLHDYIKAPIDWHELGSPSPHPTACSHSILAMLHEMQFNDLNTDIFLYLARYFLPRGERLALTRTNWWLNHALTHTLLQGTVSLQKFHLPSFLDFIRLRSGQELAPYLRRLVLEPCDHGHSVSAAWSSISDSDTLRAFIDILQLASHLNFLSIASPYAISTEMTPETLQRGLAHPPNLREIVLRTFPPEYHDVLAGVGSNLTAVQFGPDNIGQCAD
ncbi:hypothetical protein C8Q78DRAFT_793843 [Trametes maxima]|nr:hypothetical protein C8Q78DRAFT_793843 [Trametes maxima]